MFQKDSTRCVSCERSWGTKTAMGYVHKGWRGYCRACHQRACRTGELRKLSDMSLEEYFWHHVDKDGPVVPHLQTPCWPWAGPRRSGGYGRIRQKGDRHRAHVLSWKLANGVSPHMRLAQSILHHCDNPPCVNPAHLYKGTQAANIADKVVRDRQPHGEGIWNAKLTEGAVREIRTNPEVKPAVFAERYGVHVATVRSVMWGLTWTRVEPEIAQRALETRKVRQRKQKSLAAWRKKGNPR